MLDPSFEFLASLIFPIAFIWWLVKVLVDYRQDKRDEPHKAAIRKLQAEEHAKL